MVKPWKHLAISLFLIPLGLLALVTIRLNLLADEYKQEYINSCVEVKFTKQQCYFQYNNNR